jgi:hypothetical protein
MAFVWFSKKNKYLTIHHKNLCKYMEAKNFFFVLKKEQRVFYIIGLEVRPTWVG